MCKCTHTIAHTQHSHTMHTQTHMHALHALSSQHSPSPRPTLTAASRVALPVLLNPESSTVLGGTAQPLGITAPACEWGTWWPGRAPGWPDPCWPDPASCLQSAGARAGCLAKGGPAQACGSSDFIRPAGKDGVGFGCGAAGAPLSAHTTGGRSNG